MFQIKKQGYLAIILLFCSIVVYSQNSLETIDDSISKAKQILFDVRKSVGIEQMSIASFSWKINISYKTRTGETREILEELKVLLPDKIHSVKASSYPFPNKTEYMWNGSAYKATSEVESFGQRNIFDITERSLNKTISSTLTSKDGNQIGNKSKIYERDTPKEYFFQDIWKLYFPITFDQPFEKNLEYRYVGKAKSDKQIANVIDVESKNNRKYRFLFDEKTNHLLLLIESFKSKRGYNEKKYYYTNREVVNGLSIPRKIKIEEKFTPTGEEPRFSFVYITIEEFKLNPELKESMFDIN